MSAAAACVAETATFPFDMVKTRLMIQGNEAGVAKKGMMQMGTSLVRDEVHWLLR